MVKATQSSTQTEPRLMFAQSLQMWTITGNGAVKLNFSFSIQVAGTEVVASVVQAGGGNLVTK